MIYGIETKSGVYTSIVRFPNRRQPSAVAWVNGEHFDGVNFQRIGGRWLYRSPRGWRPRLPCSQADLAAQITESCARIGGAP